VLARTRHRLSEYADERVASDLGDDATDDFTDFWAERNYVPDANKIKTEKTAVFMVHGLEDWNVKRAHFSRLWYEVARRNMPRKI
jgi:X-Pro dipeptidyl-peptidase